MRDQRPESKIHAHNWVTYILTRLFCHRDDRKVAYDLYQYFRHCDDYVDDPRRSPTDKLSFISDQRRIVNAMYDGHFEPGSRLAEIIRYDHEHQNSFRELFHEMLDLFEFDARRSHRSSSARSLIEYSRKLSHAYTTLLVMFMKPEYEICEHDIQLAH